MDVSKKMALSILNEVLKSGADFAELYVQNKLTHTIALTSKKVDSDSSSLVYGASLRLIKGNSVVFGYTSDLSKKSLFKLADTLASSFSGERKVTVDKLNKIYNSGHHQPKIPHDAYTDEKKIALMRVGEKAAYGVSPLIVNVNVNLLETDEAVDVFNSNGRYVHDNRTRTRVYVVATAGKDGQFQTGVESPGASIGLEIFDMFDFDKLGKKAADVAVRLLDAPECPSGKMTVIIGNKFGGVLFHESCGHPLEGVAIAHKTSVFWDKMGQMIASPIVSAEDNGTIENGWGSSNFDDEGERTTKNVLIKNGVLVNYMMDDFNGKKLSRATTGACRRESYKFLPTTRMTNTYICAGKSTPEEIIKNTKSGLYCVSFNGGSVDPSTDKFNFTSSESYIIKNGKIDHLVKDASLIGFGYEILKNIDMVGNDLGRGEGMCGASSGSIPADVGQPTIRVQNMTVGGRGGKI